MQIFSASVAGGIHIKITIIKIMQWFEGLKQSGSGGIMWFPTPGRKIWKTIQQLKLHINKKNIDIWRLWREFLWTYSIIVLLAEAYTT